MQGADAIFRQVPIRWGQSIVYTVTGSTYMNYTDSMDECLSMGDDPDILVIAITPSSKQCRANTRAFGFKLPNVDKEISKTIINTNSFP